MSQNLITKTLQIAGMTCVSCENRIERKLKNTKGIASVNVSYGSGTAKIAFDANIISLTSIEIIIKELDYKVVKAEQTKQKTDVPKVIGIAVVLFSVYMLLRQFGLLNIFNAFPEAEADTGYGMLFIIGLLTSVHCVAMCGGINLSQCMSQSIDSNPKAGKLMNIRPSFLYNLGRVISYTIVGGIVGALGKVVSFSGPVKGIVQLAAGIFMVIMGLNMLNIFPWLRKFNIRIPKIFASKIGSEKMKSESPFYVGLLNGLMPCGPLQAMQLYALSTGSPIEGAASMFLFSLGTVPLMFGLGALSSILSKKFTSKMMTVGAVLVVVLGMSMFSNGMSLSGLMLPSLFGNAQNASAAQLDNGVQTITTKLVSGSYEPITVQVGIPVKWTITAEAGTVNGCNNKIIIKEYNLEKKLEVGDNVIEFTPTKTGTFTYSCWMGMIRSSITVVDNINSTPQSTENPDSGNPGAPNGLTGGADSGRQGLIDGLDGGENAGGGCCGGSTSGAFANGQIPTDDIQIAKEVDGIQEVTVAVNSYGYSPAVVILEKGKDFIIKFNPEELTGCNSTVYFPEYGGGINLYTDQATPVLTADEDFSFECSMSMLHGYVKVVDDINNIEMEAIKKDVENFKPSPDSGSGGGCCG